MSSESGNLFWDSDLRFTIGIILKINTIATVLLLFYVSD